MIKRVLIALALVGAMAACNTPAATTSPSAPALDTAPPALESPSAPAEESPTPSSS